MFNDRMEDLRTILLNGNRERAAALVKEGSHDIILQKNEIMRDLTNQYNAGTIPFCQLSAACQAAAAFYDSEYPPVACCGAVYGNSSPTGNNYMMMLLHGWGIPTLDLGTDVKPATFLSAVRHYNLRFVVCVAFSKADIQVVKELHEQALSQGMRNRFSLLLTGISLDLSKDRIPVDYQACSSAEIARWMVDVWKS